MIVIVLTNDVLPEYKKICDEFGADYFFDKSTEFEKTSALINKTIHTSLKQKRKGK